MINKITIKNNVKIVNEEYVIKKSNPHISERFNYLLSRSFDYFPEIIGGYNEYTYYKYIHDIDEPNEQKMVDLINLLSLLHSKTTFYKEIDLDNYKLLYENINTSIDDTYNYYDNLMNIIDTDIYMSPSNYLIARNITIIYDAINYAKENLNVWYQKIENLRKVRVVTIHNNLSLDHYLKNDKPYFISWDKSRIDSPIYDIISLYKNHYLDYDFGELFHIYLNKYPLKEEEMILLLVILSIPDKIKEECSEYKRVLLIRRIIDYIYKTSLLVKEYGIEKKRNE